MGDLPRQRPGDLTILDMEASLEHLSRGTLHNVDVLLVLTEAYFRSLETTARIVPLARELSIENVWVVANKVQTPRDDTAIRQFCERHHYELSGVVPFDDSITQSDAVGRALIDLAPTAPAVRAIEALADRILERVAAHAPESIAANADS